MSDCPCRVIVRHRGPIGPVGPAGGGTGDVVGPASAVNNRLAAFNGITGKLIKDSGILISDVVTDVSNLVVKVTGKGLSANDFTDADKAKLDAATAENFRGEYATLLALTTAIPLGNPGDYANVVTLGTDAIQYSWDDTNDVWSSLNDTVALDGQEIADILFNPTDAAGYTQVDTRIYTTADKTAVDGAASLTYVNSLALAAGIIAPAYAAMVYFDLIGVSVPIIGISDGTSNFVKIGPTTTLDPASSLFDSPAVARLRYTGTETRLFVTTYQASFNGPASSEMVFGLGKNGSVIPTSRAIEGTAATPITSTVSGTCLVSLSTNDYLEVFVGNTTNVNDPTVKLLALEISPA